MKQNRTKAAIASAFTQLLADYPIDKITVKMITDSVGCSRKTFYYYFTDVYALTRHFCDEQVSRFLESNGDVDNMRSEFLNLTSYFRSDRQVILNMYHGYGKEELERFVLQTSLRIARNYIAAMPEAQGVSKEDQDTVAHMIAYLFFGIMVEWTGEEMVHDEDYRKTLDTALSSLPAILKSMHGKA